jgi:predicted RNA polymerase sigma factor
MVAVLTRIFGVHNLALAEDVVQDAFCRALETWSFQGRAGEPFCLAHGCRKESCPRCHTSGKDSANLRARVEPVVGERMDVSFRT